LQFAIRNDEWLHTDYIFSVYSRAKHIEQARGVLDLNANELSLPKYSHGKDIASVAKHLEMLNVILSGKEERLEPNSSEEVKLLGVRIKSRM
jgi:hypothetical protein